MGRCVEQEFNSFKQFKSFKPPPLSSPASRGRLSMKLVKNFLKKSFTPPDASSDERCWPGGSFHRKVYGLAT